MNLSANWTHFFWLTGETPCSLSELVVDIQNKFKHVNCPGRPCILDFRNQVQLKFKILFIFED